MASSSRARSSSPFSYRKPSSPYSSSNSSTSSHPGNRLMPRSCSTSASSYLNSGGGLGSQTTARSCSDAAYYGGSGSQTLVTYGAEEIAASEPADAPRGGDSISVTIRFRPLRKSDLILIIKVPALLDELGVTAGVSNSGLVSSSYFYLSVIRKLQDDDLQVALHFLQAVMACPALFLVEFRLLAGLCGVLFPSLVVDEPGEVTGCEGLVKQLARKYKHWLMYYQIMNSGGVPRWHCRSRDALVSDGEPRQEMNSCRNSVKSVQQESCTGDGIKIE